MVLQSSLLSAFLCCVCLQHSLMRLKPTLCRAPVGESPGSADISASIPGPLICTSLIRMAFYGWEGLHISRGLAGFSLACLSPAPALGLLQRGTLMYPLPQSTLSQSRLALLPLLSGLLSWCLCLPAPLNSCHE